MKFIFKYLKPYYLRMVTGLIIKFTGCIMDLFLPMILAYIIDTVVPTQNKTMIVFWGIVMVLCSVCGVSFNIIANRKASAVARDSARQIRYDLFQKTLRLSGRQVDEIGVSSLDSRLTTDTYNVHNIIGMMQRMGVRAPILFLGGVIVSFKLEPVLTGVMVAAMPPVVLVVYMVSKKGIPLYGALQKKVDHMIVVIRENISGIRIIKALSKTEYEKNRFEEANEGVNKADKHASAIMAISDPVITLMLNIGLAAVIIVGAYRVNAGVSETGTILAFISYFTIISNAMLAVTRIFVMMSKAIASAKRIEQIMELPEEPVVLPDNQINTCTADKQKEAPFIEFENVSFSYNKVGYNLENISFKLEKGQTLGIIGATGSGKTTLISLLLRFYDADEGNVYIGGRDIRSIPLAVLHSKFGAVFQNDFLFADSIAENISFGRNLDAEIIEAAAKTAQAYEFIEKIPEKYEHKLNIKAANVSGGQKQRVLISRAVAAEPEILVLDDSSSALDYKTDAMLRKAIHENCSDTTMIVVAQRVSSVKDADLIIVLDKGKITAAGKHEELMESSTIYQEIARSQMGGDFGE